MVFNHKDLYGYIIMTSQRADVLVILTPFQGHRRTLNALEGINISLDHT